MSPAEELERATAELVSSGMPIPFQYRSNGSVGDHRRLVLIRDSSGSCRGGFALDHRPLGLAPGHEVASIRRFGPSVPPSAVSISLGVLSRLVRSNPRILRLSVTTFCRDPARRACLREAFSTSGFAQTETDGYRHTLVLDLRPSVEDVLAGFHRSARRNIRQVSRYPIALRPIRDGRHAEAMHRLCRATYGRTGGTYIPTDWAARVAYSALNPDVSRLVGVFSTEPGREEELLAFAWGQNNGDHAEYAESASTSETGTRMPLAYPLVWDLTQWAKSWGAEWLDLGGVTLQDDDPLAGISDFKRFFSKEVVEVGATWTLRPHTLRARTVQVMQPALARALKRLRGAG